jgi:hypothetical protein
MPPESAERSARLNSTGKTFATNPPHAVDRCGKRSSKKLRLTPIGRRQRRDKDRTRYRRRTVARAISFPATWVESRNRGSSPVAAGFLQPPTVARSSLPAS